MKAGNHRPEVRLKGIAAAPGVARGPAYPLMRGMAIVSCEKVADPEVEIRRLEAALAATAEAAGLPARQCEVYKIHLGGGFGRRGIGPGRSSKIGEQALQPAHSRGQPLFVGACRRFGVSDFCARFGANG